jgi:hypothetical protein
MSEQGRVQAGPWPAKTYCILFGHRLTFPLNIWEPIRCDRCGWTSAPARTGSAD